MCVCVCVCMCWGDVSFLPLYVGGRYFILLDTTGWNFEKPDVGWVSLAALVSTLKVRYDVITGLAISAYFK